jgi:hypothetical protein
MLPILLSNFTTTSFLLSITARNQKVLLNEVPSIRDALGLARHKVMLSRGSGETSSIVSQETTIPAWQQCWHLAASSGSEVLECTWHQSATLAVDATDGR